MLIEERGRGRVKRESKGRVRRLQTGANGPSRTRSPSLDLLRELSLLAKMACNCGPVVCPAVGASSRTRDGKADVRIL